LQARARLFEYRGQIEQAKKTWKEAATLLSSFRQKSETAGLKGRGYALEEAYCLERSGEAEQAKEILDKMIALFPQEFTYHFALASLKKRAKSYNEALVSAKKAFEYSYGDNRIRAATLLIQLYTTIPDKEAARNLYATVRGEFKVDPDLEVRTHRYLRTLDEAWLAASQ
jgi:tetratricopeptide (TPR) repeat protein